MANGNYEYAGNKITLKWDAIVTPDAINPTYLSQHFKEYYAEYADDYYKKRLEYNSKNIGTLGYQIYLQTDTGLQSIGFTSNPFYSYQATTSGTYTFVIKSAYSIFKSNMSNGITLSTNVTVAAPIIPTPPVEPEIPEQEEIITP